MSDTITQYRIVLSSGPIGNVFFTLEQAVETSRQLEATGVRVHSITHGERVFEGAELRDLLGEIDRGTFDAFPR